LRAFDFVAGEVLLIDKPLTWTSFDAVNKIRWMLKQKLGVKLKVGHAGTLDPLATGLLIICTGKQTKNIDSYQAQEKEYTGTFVVGATTPCFDLEKEIDQYHPVNHIRKEDVDAALPEFIGEIDQVPPVFSAIWVDGKRSYDKARAGKEVELPPRKVTISEFWITQFRHVPNENHPEGQLLEFDFRVVCSKGTYIRSLARDFGIALGSGAHLSKLCRTRIGNFELKDAMTLEQFAAAIEVEFTRR
jgi:tRNA pseudouridine55 synthase